MDQEYYLAISALNFVVLYYNLCSYICIVMIVIVSFRCVIVYESNRTIKNSAKYMRGQVFQMSCGHTFGMSFRLNLLSN